MSSLLENSPQVKTGKVTHYHEFLFLNTWKERYLVLYQDSSLKWYSDQTSGHLEGSISLKFVAPLLAIGERTATIQGKPKLESPSQERLLMGVPEKPTKDSKIEWFLFPDEESVQSWVGAIQSVLRPFQPGYESTPSAPPPPYSPRSNQPGYPGYQGYPGYNLTQPANFGNYPGAPYPRQVQPAPLNYSMQPYPRGSCVVPQRETIIIREEDRSDDNFVAGVLLGGAAMAVADELVGDCWDDPAPVVYENTEVVVFEDSNDYDF